MSVTLQTTSTVKVFSDSHGVFTVNGDRFARRLEMIVNNVNFDSNAYRALRAALSEATEYNYFDADLVMIVAATIECSFDDFTINELLAGSDDELWATDVYDRIASSDPL